MKLRIGFLAALLVLALAMTAFGQEQAKPTEKAEGKSAPKLVVVEKPDFDFGKVKEGEEITHTFKIKNEGTGELVIANVSPACGCTASDFSKTVAPGAEGMVKLTVRTAGMNGKTSRYADIISNDPKDPTLKLWLYMEVEKPSN